MKSSSAVNRALFGFLLPASVAAGVLTGAVGLQPAHAELRLSTLQSTPTDDTPSSEDGATTEPAEPENMLTWSIAPSLQEAPDSASDDEDPQERVSFRVELEPGETLEDEVVVTNFSEEELTFDLITSDGIVTEEGLFDLLPDPAESEGSGTWIDIDEQVTVPAGDSATVPFTLTVPEDALPGDHPAGIAARVAADGNALSLDAQVGARIHLRVAGDIVPTVAIDDVEAHYTPSWNPFAPGVLSVDWTVENTGNVRLGSEQTLGVEGLFGLSAGVAEQAVASQREILPGQSTANSVEVEAWPLGLLTASLTATQNVVGDDEIAVELTSATSETKTWAVPWVYLIALLLLVALVVTMVVRRRRRQRTMADALAAARAEGRRETATEPSDATTDSDTALEDSPDERREPVS